MHKKEQKIVSKDNKKQHDMLAKVLVIGDGGVGKTAMIYRFTQGMFYISYTATIGVDFKSKIIKCKDKNIKLQIWDTAGQERFKNITQAYYRGATGILLAFSLTDKASFKNVEKWITQIDENASKECCKLLVGTKLDCQSQRVISRGEAESLAVRMGVDYIETSAKSNDNIEQMFELLGKKLYDILYRNILNEASKQKQTNRHKFSESIRVTTNNFINNKQQKKCNC